MQKRRQKNHRFWIVWVVLQNIEWPWKEAIDLNSKKSWVYQLQNYPYQYLDLPNRVGFEVGWHNGNHNLSWFFGHSHKILVRAFGSMRTLRQYLVSLQRRLGLMTLTPHMRTWMLLEVSQGVISEWHPCVANKGIVIRHKWQSCSKHAVLSKRKSLKIRTCCLRSPRSLWMSHSSHQWVSQKDWKQDTQRGCSLKWRLQTTESGNSDRHREKCDFNLTLFHSYFRCGTQSCTCHRYR